MTLLEQIVSILTSAQYKRLSRPFLISSLSYDFSAALIAGERALDLVLMVDLFEQPDEKSIIQNVASLARALDVAQSRRPMTTIIIGGELTAAALETLGRTSRVLAIGIPPEDGAEQYLRDWLAVLLPLPKFDTLSSIADWKAKLDSDLGDVAAERTAKHFIDSATKGQQAVEQSLKTEILDIVRTPMGENTP
jgi:hypothetical protein